MIDNISIIMPVYNSAEYVSYAIKSILLQSFRNFELIIVNDGSDDNSEAEILKFTDPRIKYYKINHCGIASARNFGIEKAVYDWIANADSDDLSHPDRLKKQVEFINKNKSVNIISCNYAFFKRNKIVHKIKLPEDNIDIKKNMFLHSSICDAGVIFNKDLVLNIGGYQDVLPPEYSLWLKLFDKARYLNLQDTLYFVRVNEKSVSFRFAKRIKENTYQLQNKLFKDSDLLNEFYPTENEKFKLQFWREYFYGDMKTIKLSSPFLLKNPKILSAFLVSKLPESFLIKNNYRSFYPRLTYMLKYFSNDNIKTRKEFKELLNLLK